MGSTLEMIARSQADFEASSSVGGNPWRYREFPKTAEPIEWKGGWPFRAQAGLRTDCRIATVSSPKAIATSRPNMVWYPQCTMTAPATNGKPNTAAK